MTEQTHAKRVLVTGGSGFIGSHVVDELRRRGIEPRIFDLAPSPHHDDVDTTIGDLMDDAALDRALIGCDAVIHLAASADVGIVKDEPRVAEEVNSRGTMRVLEAARRAGNVRVVYGSTIWVYGAYGEGILDEDSPFGLPDHLYTASKLAGEMYCRSFSELYGVPTTILRFGIPYGPRARPAAVIPIFVRKALDGEPLTLAGGGLQTREFVYVGDLAEGIVKGLAPEAADRAYNLSSRKSVSIKELAEAVQDEIGDVEIVHTPGRAGDFGGAEISSARAEAELGWRTSTSLAEGIRHYIAWAREEEARDAAEAERAAAEPTSASYRWPLGATRAATASACAAGTLIPTLIAVRMNEFGATQIHTVALTTLLVTILCLSFGGIVTRRETRAPALAWGIGIGYLALFILPWTRSALNIGVPDEGSLVLVALGMFVALAIAAAVGRWRAVIAPEPDRA